jgi:hypothetical protein
MWGTLSTLCSGGGYPLHGWFCRCKREQSYTNKSQDAHGNEQVCALGGYLDCQDGHDRAMSEA